VVVACFATSAETGEAAIVTELEVATAAVVNHSQRTLSGKAAQNHGGSVTSSQDWLPWLRVSEFVEQNPGPVKALRAFLSQRFHVRVPCDETENGVDHCLTALTFATLRTIGDKIAEVQAIALATDGVLAFGKPSVW